MARYAAEGPAGLHERSHAPHACPHACPHAVAAELPALLLAARRAHPTWGPAKNDLSAADFKGQFRTRAGGFRRVPPRSAAFRRGFNAERPRAALGGDTPGARYAPSPRPFPGRRSSTRRTTR